MDCDKEYKLTDSLRKHVKVTHNENVTMTCCKFCDKVFMDTSQKPGHMASMHSGESSLFQISCHLLKNLKHCVVKLFLSANSFSSALLVVGGKGEGEGGELFDKFFVAFIFQH